MSHKEILKCIYTEKLAYILKIKSLEEFKKDYAEKKKNDDLNTLEQAIFMYNVLEKHHEEKENLKR